MVTQLIVPWQDNETNIHRYRDMKVHMNAHISFGGSEVAVIPNKAEVLTSSTSMQTC